jgi:hypothetical protein
MVKIHHPRGVSAVWPTADGPRVRLYGTVGGWPLWVRYWRTPPPPDARALQLEHDLWIELEVRGCISPAAEPQLVVPWDDG